MLTSIEIERLRGIRQGKLEDLTPLVVLVGPNGCGKSTVLDAMLIGASSVPARGVETAVRTRRGLVVGAPWLVWRRGQKGNASVVANTEDATRRVDVSVQHPELLSVIYANPDEANRRSDSVPFTDEWPEDHTYTLSPLPGIEDAHFLDPSAAIDHSLAVLYSSLIPSGASIRDKALRLMSELLPGVADVQVALDEKGGGRLYVLYPDRGIDLGGAGDGVQVLLRTALELAAHSGETVLVEEPEAHLHLRAIRLSADLVCEAVTQGTQVVISTHSLEYIDALLDALGEDDLDKLSVYRMKLNEDGTLRTARMNGRNVAALRQDILDDLR